MAACARGRGSAWLVGLPLAVALGGAWAGLEAPTRPHGRSAGARRGREGEGNPGAGGAGRGRAGRGRTLGKDVASRAGRPWARSTCRLPCDRWAGNFPCLPLPKIFDLVAMTSDQNKGAEGTNTTTDLLRVTIKQLILNPLARKKAWLCTVTVSRLKSSLRTGVFEVVEFTTLNMEGSVNAENWKLGSIPVNLYLKQDQLKDSFYVACFLSIQWRMQYCNE